MRIIMGLLIVTVVFFGCTGTSDFNIFNSDNSENLQVSALVEIQSDYLNKIGQAYLEGQFVDHATYSAGLIKQMVNNQNEHLVKADCTLIAAIAEYGVEPFYTVLIEYTYRLNHAPSDITNERFEYFKSLLSEESNEASTQIEDLSSYTTILRSTDNGSSFRPYSYNLAKSVLEISMTEIGEALYKTGSAPDDMVRIADLMMSCKEYSANQVTGASNVVLTENQLSSAISNCNEFMTALAGLLGIDSNGQGMDEFAGGVTGPITLGYASGISDCLKDLANEERVEQINKVEDARSCAENQQVPKNIGINQDGNSYNYTQDFEDFSGILPDNYEEEGEPSTLGFNHNDLSNGVDEDFSKGRVDISTQFFVNSENPTEKVKVEKFFAASVNEQYGNQNPTYKMGHTISTSSYGGTLRETYTNQGDWTPPRLSKVEWSDGNGSYSAEMDGGKIVSETMTDSDGSVTKVTYDSEGNKKETKWDSNGNCISGCINNSNGGSSTNPQPINVWEINCNYQEVLGIETPNGSDDRIKVLVDGDDAQPYSVSCLTNFASRITTNTCKYLNTLCPDGKASGDDCSCSGGLFTEAPVISCSLIDCAAGICDPNGSACIAAGGYPPFPGSFSLPSLTSNQIGSSNIQGWDGTLSGIRDRIWNGSAPDLPDSQF